MNLYQCELRDYRNDGSVRKWFDNFHGENFCQAEQNAHETWGNKIDILSITILPTAYVKEIK